MLGGDRDAARALARAVREATSTHDDGDARQRKQSGLRQQCTRGLRIHTQLSQVHWKPQQETEVG